MVGPLDRGGSVGGGGVGVGTTWQSCRHEPSRCASAALVSGPEEVLAERAIATLLEQARAAGAEVIRLDAADLRARRAPDARQPVALRRRQGIVVQRPRRGARRAAGRPAAASSRARRRRHPGRHPQVGASAARRSSTRSRRQRRGVIECPGHQDRPRQDRLRRATSSAGRAQGHPRGRARAHRGGRQGRARARRRPAPARRRHRRAPSTTRLVDNYHGGKVEATGFRVADAAVAGQTGEALRLLRHAIAHGRRPGPDRRRPRPAAAPARQGRRRPGRGARADWRTSLGMAPWQVDKARRAVGLEPPRGSPGHPGRRRRRLRGQGRRPRPGLRRRARRSSRSPGPAAAAERAGRPAGARGIRVLGACPPRW